MENRRKKLLMPMSMNGLFVDVKYDDVNKTLILTLSNGQKVVIPTEDIISGLQETLVSEVNIKSLTVNGVVQTLLDSGTIDLTSYIIKDGEGEPTAATEADYLGQFYFDTASTPCNIYQCTNIDTTVTPTAYTWVRLIKITDVNGGAQSVTVSNNGTITDTTTQRMIALHLPVTINGMLFSYSSDNATKYQYYNISLDATKEMNTVNLITINKTDWVVKFYNNLFLQG